MEHFNTVILGGGSAGETVAAAIARDRKPVALVEVQRVGGECPFVACMPSKAMLHRAYLQHLAAGTEYPRSAGHESHGTASMTPIVASNRNAYAQAVAWRDQVAERRDDSAHARKLEAAGVSVIRDWGRVLRPGILSVESCGELAWQDLVIATGSVPSTPRINGLGVVSTWNSDDALTSTEYPATVAILGGGPVGCELAQIFARFGSAVSLVEAVPRLLSHEEPEIGEVLAGVLREGGVALHLATNVIEARAATMGSQLLLDDGTMLTVERVIVATGRAPRTNGLK